MSIREDFEREVRASLQRVITRDTHKGTAGRVVAQTTSTILAAYDKAVGEVNATALKHGKFLQKNRDDLAFLETIGPDLDPNEPVKHWPIGGAPDFGGQRDRVRINEERARLREWVTGKMK